MSKYHIHTRVSIYLLFLLMIGSALTSCTAETGETEQVNKVHEEYISSFGWHLEKGVDSILHPKGYYTGERLQMLKSVGIEITPYADSEIRESIYLLQERQENGNIYFHIYEQNDKIIGAHLAYEGYSPGLVTLKKRE